MDEQERMRLFRRAIEAAGKDLDAHAEGVAHLPCLNIADGRHDADTLRLDAVKNSATCSDCRYRRPADEYLAAFRAAGLPRAPEPTSVEPETASPVPAAATSDVFDQDIEPEREPAPEPELAPLPAVRDPAPVPAQQAAQAPDLSADASMPVREDGARPLEAVPEGKVPESVSEVEDRGSGVAEKLIITPMALVFLVAGLSAACLSGFANYQAFSRMVAEPIQSSVWGWTGVIASVCSFGGFTFFWWHMAGRRIAEALRSAVFALAGAATSVVGTQLYIADNNAEAAARVARAQAARPALEAQVEAWRSQLSNIPADTRSVEGLEAYISEVERVGRADQKPYRDAKNELGLAKRRDALEHKLEAATARLTGDAGDEAVTPVTEAPRAPGWFFAGMLELFASQGTSIGTVALLILFTRRRRSVPA